MLMSKKNRIKIFEYLFKEGVLVAKKDYQIKHTEIDVPNLHVIKALQSLVSKGYVTEQFCWRHYYWYLNNEGIQYLRDFLHLPPEIVPATLKRQVQASRPDAARRPRGPDYGGRPQMSEDRAAYRRGPPGERKEAGAGPNPNFQFRGGFGRGGGAPQPDQE